jgi:predicted O-methyltransferase YrrM
MPSLREQCPVVGEMLTTGSVRRKDGTQVDIHSNISSDFAEALFDLVVQRKPKVIVEIGMAFGLSTLAMLAGQQAAGIEGRVISIDPKQTDWWGSSGIEAVERAGYAGRHELIEDYDYSALPVLLASGLRADLGYIDGWHTFDHAFLDWWYLDKLVDVGGVIGFNDCSYPAVDRVISFVETHRDYTEVQTRLSAMDGRSPLRRVASRVKHVGRRTPQWIDRYFEKVTERTPAWDFYAKF